MIKSFTATTREIDDAKAAVAEILAELDIESKLLKNSVGIISCFSEFGEEGVLQAVCDALPFDCIGATTCICAAGTELDQVLLTITVLTSDDCSFDAVAIPITSEYKEAIKAGLAPWLGERESRPALILSYFPLMNEISGDVILDAVDAATGGIPLFGTMTVDHMPDYATATTIYNGETFRETAVLCLVGGAPEFSFEVASFDKDKIRNQKAIITASEGNILIGVNGKTALEYLSEIGLTENEVAAGLGIIPLVIDHKDGTQPVARAAFAITPDGHAVCGGAMPVGATLALGHVDMEDVLRTTSDTMTPLVRGGSAILSYSCIARYTSLGANFTSEAEKVREVAAGTDYMFACSGGEICPLPDANGKLKNFFHNYTIVFCRLS